MNQPKLNHVQNQNQSRTFAVNQQQGVKREARALHLHPDWLEKVDSLVNPFALQSIPIYKKSRWKKIGKKCCRTV